MPGDFLENDLTIFTSTAEFGTVAVWTPTDNNPVNVSGIFDDVRFKINPFTGDNDSTTDAVFTCAISDVEGILQGETMVIDSVTYKVKVVPSSTSDYMYELKLRRS